MHGPFCCAFGGYPSQKHIQGTFAFRGIPARQGSEPRVRSLKVLQSLCCERFGCRILPCFKVQMLPLPLHLNQWRCSLNPCNGKFLNELQWISRVLLRFRCLGCSAGPFGSTPARSTSRAHLQSVAFQPHLGSEPRVQLLKVLQCVCCEWFGCRILPCFKVQMLPFTAASEPGEMFAKTAQYKVSQCVAAVCLSFFPVQMPWAVLLRVWRIPQPEVPLGHVCIPRHSSPAMDLNHGCSC